jgi:site-specific DNA recombinase
MGRLTLNVLLSFAQFEREVPPHLRSQSGVQASAIAGHSAIAEVIDRIDVHKDRLVVRLRSRESPGTTKHTDDVEEPADDCPLSIPWQKPPSKRFRQILLPHGFSRKEVRPERPERRLRLVGAIARGRRWLDEIVSGSVTSAEQIALRERCVNRRSNLTPYRRPILALTHFWCSDRRAAGGTVADSTSWGNHRRCAVRPIPRR